MEVIPKKMLLSSSSIHFFIGPFNLKCTTQTTQLLPFSNLMAKSVFKSPSSTYFAPRNTTKVCAMRRRRRSNTETDTYVLMEPDKNEEFVTEEELRERLKSWLENWPGGNLPLDLANFETIDDAVNYLVKSVCELEIDGDVGSIQWYQVRLD